MSNLMAMAMAYMAQVIAASVCDGACCILQDAVLQIVAQKTSVCTCLPATFSYVGAATL